MYNDFICYDFFPPAKGVNFSKYFNLGYVCAGLICSFINFQFYDPNFIKKSFMVMFVLNLGLFYIVFQSFKLKLRSEGEKLIN